MRTDAKKGPDYEVEDSEGNAYTVQGLSPLGALLNLVKETGRDVNRGRVYDPAVQRWVTAQELLADRPDLAVPWIPKVTP